MNNENKTKQNKNKRSKLDIGLIDWIDEFTIKLKN